MVFGSGGFDRQCVGAGAITARRASLLGAMRAQLLGNASRLALPAAALALGVSLASGASAQTVIGSRTTTYNLNPANNPFLINSGTTLNATSGDAIDGNNTVPWILTNNGTVTGHTTGIDLQSQSTVTNAGTITGTTLVGVYLGAGGSVTNQAGGTISGFQAGVRIGGAASTVTNAGSISGTRGFGVYLHAGGVTNQAGGAISGYVAGVDVSGGAGTVTNAGSITGGFGVYLGAGGSVTNQVGGTISGFQGVAISGAAGTVTNAGTITGTTLVGVYLGAGGSVTNHAGGTISGFQAGVRIGGAASTVTNAGSITGTRGFGVYLHAGGVTNQAGGAISGYVAGVDVSGAAGTVTNAGSITGGFGVYLGAGGSVTNQVGGTISGAVAGVAISGAAGTVTNAGSITGTGGLGVYLHAGGSVTNQAGGTISGGIDGVRVGGAAGTVTNAGTITGGTDSVLFFGVGANVLTLQTGSVLNGAAVGSTPPGATNALILQGAGTANNNFVNFTTLDVQASGLWSLGGTSTFGTATVSSGTLAVTGNLTSADTLMVNAGGTLAGTGLATATNGVFINSGGAVQGGLPGTIGTLNLNGNLTFNPGGILATTIAPSAASLVNVAGLATLSGGTVQVTASSFITHTETFTILTATNLSGSFSSASVVGTAFARNPRLTQDANDVFLTVDAGSFAAVLPASATGNQVNVAKAIDAGIAGGGALPAGFLTLGNLPVANLPGALTQLAGETATGSQQTTFDAMTQFMGLLLDPFIDGRGAGATSGAGATPFAEEDASAYAADGKKGSKRARDAYGMFTKAPPAPFEARWSTWAAGFGGSQTTDGNAAVGSNSTTSRIFGTAVGADYRFSPFTIAGFALAGGGTNFSVANGGTGRSDLFQAGAFIRHDVGAAYLSGALAYGWQDVTTDRTVAVAGIDRLHAEFNANAFSGRIEGGYRFVSPWIGGIGLTPYAAGQFTTFDLPAYAESALAGSNGFALAYGSQSVTDTRSELGLRTDKSFALPNAILTLRGRAAWAHDFNPDRNIAATFQALPGASFVVNGAAQASDSALTTASVELKWLNGWSAAATFEGEFSDVTRSYAGKGVVRYAW
jgi:uncharacterized protein with beta-barrel porin domain